MRTVDKPQDPLEQAADWQIRLQEEPDARADFEQWLMESDAHRAAWRKMETLWSALGELPAKPEAAYSRSVVLKPSRPPQLTTRSRRRWLALATAAGVAAIAAIMAPQATMALRADYQTGVAQIRTVHLADGSTVVLSPQSALKVLDADGRQVELLKGQAYFHVARDPQHPFIAHAGQLSVRVLGTAFDLDLHQDAAEVALEHGQVQAENAQPPLSERLMPGQRLKFSWPSGKVERSSLEPTQVAAWRTGSLFIENQSVADIVDQLQRYTSGWIVITDPSLKTRRITGVYDLNNPPRALKALAQSLGVNSRQMTPWVHTLGNF
ncbi:FecR family protein [Pseudomonas sp. MYb60]|uniref:FecR family protein n=1 Tax=Pseudomonas sp. MYb60 TaxID=1848738 RepID=UPI000CFC3AB4|nr:FecR family protein [Pseudomonas sp. MYb60]PQZ93126.1 iron dicitrate transport regulator FecR [Pseudomonas trivialis]PRB28447.1 iron dicitrate transport regulator FecR [Pseudomonas sp. MYb60]